MELLAPAGSYEALSAAVQSGADAVYAGGSRFSARGSAHNFNNDELAKWVKYCHLHGVAVHIAANTLVKEYETKDFLNYIGFLNEISVDAVIIQDLGMAYAAHKMFPDLALHASTQVTCASANTAKELEKIGFSRIVLARELDYKSIEKIKKTVNCEIEVFVHGAICMSYSGQCLMSSMIGGRSGNRGYCAQPCRLTYNFVNNGKNVSDGYLLSPKDMCLAEHINTLNKIGVDSLKIEGRLKRPEYVSAVVGVYRKLLDQNRKPTRNENKELLNAFNRSGFTDGYFVDQTGKTMMAYSTPSNIAENIFSDEVKARCREDAQLKKISVSINAQLKMGQPLIVEITDGINKVRVKGDIRAEYALKVPMSQERLSIQLQKLGGTVFSAKDIFIEMDDDVTVPVSEINNVRREAVIELSKLREYRKSGRVEDVDFKFDNINVNEISFTALVRNKEQAIACITKGIKRIYAPQNVIDSISDEKDVKFITVCPPVDNEKKTAFYEGSVLISALGQKNKNDLSDTHLNFRVNTANSYTLDLFRQAGTVTLSPELTLKEISVINKPCDTELIVYGHIPLMTFENCPVRAHGKCDKGNSKNLLIDRKKEEFPLVCTEGCFCELLNSKPIYMADKIDDLKKTGVKFLRLDFSIETHDECMKIIDNYKAALYDGALIARKENTFTRGHYYKAVQ